MSGRASPSRRGVALLLVLAVLMLAVTASVALARAAAISRARTQIDQATIIADDLLRAVDAPIRHWLESDSSSIVLLPDARTPAVRVLHDTWIAGAREYEITITAWDQCGMVPLESMRSASPLRLAVPPEVREAVRGIEQSRREPAGLDRFVPDPESAGLVGPFPVMPLDEPLVLGDAPPKAEHHRDEFGIAPTSDVVVGAFIATHNEPPGRINVNTAPIELLEQAIRLAGRGGIETIVEARGEGRATSIGSLTTDHDAREGAPRLVAASNAWAVRIDIRVGGVGSVRRAWWAVYVSTRRNQWECVQRLAIDT